MAGMGLDTVVLRFVKVGSNWLYWNPSKQAYVKITKGQGNLVTRLLNGSADVERKPVLRRNRRKIVVPEGRESERPPIIDPVIPGLR
jgi:hypothetical protein